MSLDSDKYLSQRAFTIVELLIVIVVIGILATITIVAYNGIQNRGHDSTMQSDLTKSSRKMDLFAVDHNGLYPAVASDLISLEIKVSAGSYAINPTVTRNFVYCPNTTFTEYTLLVKSKSGNAFIIRSNDKTIKPFSTTWDATTTGSGLCAGLGGSYNSTNAAGYWTGQTPNWNVWTGV